MDKFVHKVGAGERGQAVERDAARGKESIAQAEAAQERKRKQEAQREEQKKRSAGPKGLGQAGPRSVLGPWTCSDRRSWCSQSSPAAARQPTGSATALAQPECSARKLSAECVLCAHAHMHVLNEGCANNEEKPRKLKKVAQ